MDEKQFLKSLTKTDIQGFSNDSADALQALSDAFAAKAVELRHKTKLLVTIWDDLSGDRVSMSTVLALACGELEAFTVEAERRLIAFTTFSVAVQMAANELSYRKRLAVAEKCLTEAGIEVPDGFNPLKKEEKGK